MNSCASDILIVGGGAAGMSAALAASTNRHVSITIVDDNPRLGGQIWRAELGKTRSPAAAELISSIRSGQINIVNDAQVFAAPANNSIQAETSTGARRFEFNSLIIATGARERFLPFPGWTLPNVFGAGGLQALVKGGMKVGNRRVVVAGTGPLLLAVAVFLKEHGAKVVAIAEQAPAAKLAKFAIGMWRSPSKIAQAAVLRANVLGVPYLTNCWAESADGDSKLGAVSLTRGLRKWRIDCDLLACGFNLVPNTELAEILGCRVENGCVVVDEFQRTNLENIYCAGEPTGIGGLEASLIEGKIAGLAAAGNETKARSLFGRRDLTKRFAAAISDAFSLRDELKQLANDSTIVCRCEDVEFGRLGEFNNSRDAKLQTRCGMGPCQGRICGPATEFIFGWKPASVRPPIFPVKMENL